MAFYYLSTTMIKSPLTGSDRVNKVGEIPVSFIQSTYQKYYGIETGSYFVGLDTVSLYQCMDTGFRFYAPESLAGDGSFYEKLREASGPDYYRTNRPEYIIAKEVIGVQKRVIDIGCGEGSFLSTIEKDNQVQGIELNQVAMEAARSKGLKVSSTALKDLVENERNSYDVVCSFQVLEHVSNPRPFLEFCIDLLRPDGKLILAVPNNWPCIMGYQIWDELNMPPHHLGLWNKTAFEQLEKIFPIRLEKIAYTPPAKTLSYLRWSVQYVMVRWFGFRFGMNKLLFAAFAFILGPVLLPYIFYQYVNGDLKGHSIICVFEKKQ